MSEKIHIRLEIEESDPLAQKLLKLKESLGIRTNTELIRYLIKNFDFRAGRGGIQ